MATAILQVEDIVHTPQGRSLFCLLQMEGCAEPGDLNTDRGSDTMQGEEAGVLELSFTPAQINNCFPSTMEHGDLTQKRRWGGGCSPASAFLESYPTSGVLQDFKQSLKAALTHQNQPT